MFGANNYLPIFSSLAPISEGWPVSRARETEDSALLISSRESIGGKKWPPTRKFFVDAKWRRRWEAGTVWSHGCQEIPGSHVHTPLPPIYLRYVCKL